MEPYVGEIRVFTCNFVPSGWLACDGATLQITNYQALYALLGTKFGGNGSTTFMLPDLRGAAMLNMNLSNTGTVYQVGNTGGAETVTLTTATMPAHTHQLAGLPVNGGFPLTTNTPFELIAQPISGTDTVYAYAPGTTPPPPLVPLAATTIASTGASTPHNNMPPFQTLNVCICTLGYFPPRN